MVLYIHLWSVNIILLMLILGSIGYILNEQKQKQIISVNFFKYFNYMLSLTIGTGAYMAFVNNYWVGFPKFLLKLSLVLILSGVSISYTQRLASHNNQRSIIIIALFIIIYSISLLIGSYY